MPAALKVAVTALLVVAVSEAAKRSTLTGPGSSRSCTGVWRWPAPAWASCSSGL